MEVIMFPKQLKAIIEEKRKQQYNNPSSILKEYDELLLKHDIVRGYDTVSYKKELRKKKDIIPQLIELYKKALLPNEKEFLLDDLYDAGCNQNQLVEMILGAFDTNSQEDNLWRYGDLLYKIKNYDYLDSYEKIVSNKKYAESRQMIVLLIGKSKKENEIPFLISLLGDEDIEGHVILALSNYKTREIYQIMKEYKNHSQKWIRDIAVKYLNKYHSYS